MIVPSTRLLIVAGTVVVPAALIATLPGWAGAGYGLIGLAAAITIIDALAARRRLRGIAVQATEITRLWKDRPGKIELTVRNESRRPIPLRIGLPFPEEIVTREEELQTVLPAGAEYARLAWDCTPHRRGRYILDRCAIERPSTLGLWLVRKLLPLTLEVRVYPNLAAERKNAPAFFKRGRLGVHGQRQIGKGREFEKLREYAPGDSFDEIDWKATARRGHPITRVFQVERTQEVYIILDASRLTARPVASDPAASILERNVTASLLLALAAEKQGDLFGLITFSDRVHDFVRARNGKAHYGACRDALYTLHPRIVTPDFDELFTLLRLRLRRRALLIFLTELDDPIVAESFARNVKLLRHHLLLVGMAQPVGAHPLFEEADVNDADSVYRELAGHILWNKLREFGKVLRREGVRFSLLESDRLGPELASIYLDMKQRQLL
ncbi:MAG TPA: DUF58 domain-containing protein [Bryobacteraceae bacterium]|nr:DUF58 domain-containing protein [Bryobacteraceae bacterium]